MFNFLYRKTTLIAVSILVSTHAISLQTTDYLPLMPWPTQVKWESKSHQLTLTPNLMISSNDPSLNQNIKRWRQRVEWQTGWTLTQDIRATPIRINISVAKTGHAQPTLNSSERYQLNITRKEVFIHAETRFGAMHAMETLLQLIHSDNKSTYLPLVSITDYPRFPWRGLLLDSARHFIPVADIKRQLDGMASAKLNVFHWHLTDDQGWRFESKKYPKLQKVASDGLYYTQKEMKEIVTYATSLGIRVVPEIDLPGHASAIAVAYPALISQPGNYTMQREWGVHTPTLDPTKPETYQFIDALISEVADVFPDTYLHIGGDEVEPSQWQQAKHIQHFMLQNDLADVHALQAYFNQRVEKILAKYNRKMVGWDEIHHPELPKSIVIQSWQGQDSLAKIARSGYQGILSTGFYVDQPQYTSYHYRNELLSTPLSVNTTINKTDNAQSWRFEMPRHKGGPIKGNFTLIKSENTWRGYIDFAGKSRRDLHNISWRSPNKVSFMLDTWMGPTQFHVSLKDNELNGYILIGNVRYPTTGKKLDVIPKGKRPATVTAKTQSNILGGEVALWSENVTAPILDIKLWPRTYAIAERLWSDKSITDENSLYQRMADVDAWSTVSVGLQQNTDNIRQLVRLAQSTQIEPLQILAEAVEPAHYYTRHHLKFKAGNYHQFELLNRFVDILPPESLKTRELSLHIDTLLKERRNAIAAEGTISILQRWQQNSDKVLLMLENNYILSHMRSVALDVGKISRLGLALVETYIQDKPLTVSEVQQAQQLLDQAAQVHDEMVIPMVYPIEDLLQQIKVK